MPTEFTLSSSGGCPLLSVTHKAGASESCLPLSLQVILGFEFRMSLLGHPCPFHLVTLNLVSAFGIAAFVTEPRGYILTSPVAACHMCRFYATELPPLPTPGMRKQVMTLGKPRLLEGRLTLLRNCDIVWLFTSVL